MAAGYKIVKIDNGLRVVTYRMPQMRSVALGIWIKTGGRYESKENKGIAHFLEHLLFKGSKNYSCRKLKESIEGVGGSLNGFTSQELTCYLVKLPSGYLGLAFDILADMVINPLLSRVDIEKERTVILEELKMHKDLPQSYVSDLLDKLLWPGQPLGMTILGDRDCISRIKKEDLSLFQKQHYTSPNIVVSAAGLLDEDKFLKRVENKFFHLKNKQINRFAPAQEIQDKPQLELFHKDTEQTHLALGFHSFKRAYPLREALNLLHIVLGANMSSRLFNEIREKRGLAYEIGTQVKYFQDTGVFIVHAGIDNQKVIEAANLILKELAKIKNRLVSRDEFKQAKEFYLGQLMLSLEDTLEQMLWLGESIATLNKVYTLKDIIEEVKKIKREDIREVAASIFKEKKINLALIGPLKDKENKIYSQLSLS